MQTIKDLIQRYRNITPPDAALKNAVLKTVSSVVGIELHRGDVSIVRGTIYIHADPTIKSALFVRKSDILKQVQNEVGENNIHDLR